MTFTSSYLTSDTDALTETCEVEILASTPNVEDGFGLGGSVPYQPTLQAYPCMEIPEKVYIDRMSGLQVTANRGLLVSDPDGNIVASTRIRFMGERYQVRHILAAVQHQLKRLFLDRVGSVS